MIFSSLIFVFAFLVTTLLLYYIAPKRFRNLVLFVMSLIFYGWVEPALILVMLSSVGIAFGLGFPIAKYRETNKRKAKAFLAVSLILNLAWLLFFKYFNFFIENLRLIPFLSELKTLTQYSLPISSTPFEFLLPVGISFYTFQIMSYSIDLYRGHTQVQKSFVSFGAYVTLFPQLVAGPIVRYRDIDDMLIERHENIEDFAAGIRRFCSGLAKKIILADAAGALVSYFDASLAYEVTTLGSWLTVVFYTFQIYFDFSAYSDMAIGLGKLFGFHFLENFNYPYMSKSITEFWRRWHMSLSSWFREYLYIPLGGNRKGKLAQYRNLAIVWLATGFWHGASWNFILWGVYFLILLVVEKAFLLKLLEKAPSILSRLYALFFIAIGWLIFYYTDTAEGLRCLTGLFGAGKFTTPQISYAAIHAVPLIVVLTVGSTQLPKKLWNGFYEKTAAGKYVSVLASLLALVASMAYMVASSYSPFLYFNF